MAVPQYQVSSSSNVGRKGTLLRIRPTLQKNLTFPCGTVITVPYIGESQVLDVTAYYGCSSKRSSSTICLQHTKGPPGGMGGPFIRTRRGGPGSIGRGNHNQVLSNLTEHSIPEPSEFDNLWKVKK